MVCKDSANRAQSKTKHEVFVMLCRGAVYLRPKVKISFFFIDKRIFLTFFYQTATALMAGASATGWGGGWPSAKKVIPQTARYHLWDELQEFRSSDICWASGIVADVNLVGVSTPPAPSGPPPLRMRGTKLPCASGATGIQAIVRIHPCCYTRCAMRLSRSPGSMSITGTSIMV